MKITKRVAALGLTATAALTLTLGIAGSAAAATSTAGSASVVTENASAAAEMIELSTWTSPEGCNIAKAYAEVYDPSYDYWCAPYQTADGSKTWKLLGYRR